VVVSVAMALSCFSASAFAATITTLDNGTTIDNTHAFELYQIFTGSESQGVLSNLKWGINSQPINDETKGSALSSDSSEKVQTALGSSSSSSSKSDSEILTSILPYVDLESTPFKSRSDNDQPAYNSSEKEYTYSDIPQGYYLIKDTNANSGYYTLYVVKVSSGKIVFKPKGSVPELEKKILEGNEKTNVSSASVGETIKYWIKGTVSSRITDFTTYFYEFSDVLPKALTLSKDADNKPAVKVYIKNGNEDINPIEVTPKFYINATEDSSGNTNLIVSIQDLKSLGESSNSSNATTGCTISNETQVIVEYSAVLNENAINVGTDNAITINNPVENRVTLTFYNDPNNSGEGETDPDDGKPTPNNPSGTPTQWPTGTLTDQTKTYTTGVKVIKVDEDEKPLSGAEFTLSGNGVNRVYVVGKEYVAYDAADSNAVASEYTLWKLTDGTYTDTDPSLENIDTSRYDSTDIKYKLSDVVQWLDSTTEDSTPSIAGFVDSNGYLTFVGLGAGSYTLTETTTPAGYNTAKPISFEIELNSEFLNGDDTKDAFIVNDNENVTFNSTEKLFHVKIENSLGNSLPTTGGIGTTIFYVVGTILVLGAGVALVVRRRMRKETR
jgi:LPXTG-motif cell wall-anchored protein